MRFVQVLPESVKHVLRQTRNYYRYILNKGSSRYCPVCKKLFKKFGNFGTVPREDAICFYCGALERHRVTWLYLKKMTDLFDGHDKNMLHVAPEQAFEILLKKQLGTRYLTADLHNPRAMVKMDITDIQYPDESFDVIYCSHVLGMVPDDKRALREFYRVLKPDGWAILLVPSTADRTIEKSSVSDSAERSKIFGENLRLYGPDVLKRLKEAGFKVNITDQYDFLSKDEIALMGLAGWEEKIFYCTK